MARRIRLWGKKRGDRRTGSELWGGFGEALFFAVLFLFGSVALAVLVVSWIYDPSPNLAHGGSGAWLLLLALGSLVLIGGGGVIYTVVRVGASAERRSDLARKAASIELMREGAAKAPVYPFVPSDANLTNSPGIALAYRLPIGQSPIWRLAATAIFCLVWNGISSVLLALAINQHLAHRPDWMLSAALIPFLAAGGWSIYYFANQMLAQTGIGPTSVEISDHPLRPGGSYEVFLSQAGRLLLKSLELSLVCEEEATYRQGTDVRSDSHTVLRQTLFRRENFRIAPGLPFTFRDRVRIPPRAMHSFQSHHNAVLWKLVVRGEAEAWPPFLRSFPLVVYPGSGGGGEA